MPKTAARYVLACWIVVLGCVLAACGSTLSSAKQAASSLASKATATVTTPDSTTTPTTAPPATPPTTPPPTTAPPTTPVTTITTTITPATTPANSAATTATPSPTASASGSNAALPWVLAGLAAVVLIGLIAWLAHAAGRRRSARADWNTQLIDAYAKGAALHDAMLAAEAPGALGAPDAAFRWAEIQRRADDYGQLLYRLQETARDDDERVRIAGILAALQAARSAMDAERSGTSAAAAMPGVVRDRLAYLMASLQQLREPGVPPA